MRFATEERCHFFSFAYLSYTFMVNNKGRARGAAFTGPGIISSLCPLQATWADRGCTGSAVAACPDAEDIAGTRRQRGAVNMRPRRDRAPFADPVVREAGRVPTRIANRAPRRHPRGCLDLMVAKNTLPGLFIVY
jgi:hypothetical protein